MAGSVAGSLHVQQLVELLAVVTSQPDEESAVIAAGERAAQALEAEASAVLFGDRVAALVGFPSSVAAPVADLLAVTTGAQTWLEVPGLGRCQAVAGAWAGTHPGHLVLARWGDEPFSAEERNLVRGMARLLELTLTMLRTLRAEQEMRERSELQAVENALLAESLQERQRLLEHVSGIERAISRRDPLQQILETVTAAAGDLLGDEIVGLWIRDAEAPDRARLVSSVGLSAKRLPGVALTEAGAVGEAMRSDDVAVVYGYDHTSPVIHEVTEGRLCASMAAPVHESGRVVGGLMVASYREDRCYSPHDRQMLGTFAQNVSLALTDAHTFDRMNQAVHDTLTGLAGRALFLERLTQNLTAGGPTALLFIDLDRFKPVNDTYGHAAGDELLVTVASRIQGSLRAGDVAARFGGDEFAVMLRDVSDPREASAVADRLIREIGDPVPLTVGTVSVDASIGVALSTRGATPADLMRRADIAMYQAKRNGRGRYEMFTEEMLHAFVDAA